RRHARPRPRRARPRRRRGAFGGVDRSGVLAPSRPLRYHTDSMASGWTRLGSTARYARGKLTLREDAWRLPDGQHVVYPVLHVGVTVGVLPFVDDARVLVGAAGRGRAPRRGSRRRRAAGAA